MPAEILTEHGCYHEYYLLIAQAIEKKGQTPVTAEQGAEVISIIERCMESSDAGKVLTFA